MQCTNPVRLYKNVDRFKYPDGLLVPCGKCMSCRIARRREWTTRLWHELGYYDCSTFLTLTYQDKALPSNGSLVKKDLQNFFKRIRKSLETEDRKIKYFACGEYGSQTWRPHYHTIIFGLSNSLEDRTRVVKAWPFADWSVDSIYNNSFGYVSLNSIRYVAQYIDDKLSGDLATQMYDNFGREPVFRIMSQGLGLRFAMSNAEQIRTQLHLTVCGKPQTLPRYYINKLDVPREALENLAIDRDIADVKRRTGYDMTYDDYYRYCGPELEVRDKQKREQKDKNVHAKHAMKRRKF